MRVPDINEFRSPTKPAEEEISSTIPAKTVTENRAFGAPNNPVESLEQSPVIFFGNTFLRQFYGKTHFCFNFTEKHSFASISRKNTVLLQFHGKHIFASISRKRHFCFNFTEKHIFASISRKKHIFASFFLLLRKVFPFERKSENRRADSSILYRNAHKSGQ